MLNLFGIEKIYSIDDDGVGECLGVWIGVVRLQFRCEVLMV